MTISVLNCLSFYVFLYCFFFSSSFKCDFRWGFGTTYDVHLGLIEKRVVDFLLVLIELFC